MNILFANIHWQFGEDNSTDRMKTLQYPTGLPLIAEEISRKRRDNLFVVDNYVNDFIDDRDKGWANCLADNRGNNV